MVDFKVLVAAVMAADLDGLASMTVADAPPGAEAEDGQMSGHGMAAALARASLEAASDDEGWARAMGALALTAEGVQHPLAVAAATSTAAITATLARTTLMGGRAAAATLAWFLVGGDPIDLEPRDAIWVAGPAGLAVFAGRYRPSDLTGGESAVDFDDWGAVIGRMTGTADARK